VADPTTTDKCKHYLRWLPGVHGFDDRHVCMVSSRDDGGKRPKILPRGSHLGRVDRSYEHALSRDRERLGKSPDLWASHFSFCRKRSRQAASSDDLDRLAQPIVASGEAAGISIGLVDQAGREHYLHYGTIGCSGKSPDRDTAGAHAAAYAMSHAPRAWE
jgi:hypothetical protein